MKVGDRIRIIRMNDDNGRDWRATDMNGVEGVVDYIDSLGQIHLKGYGLALIPGVDIFQVITNE